MKREKYFNAYIFNNLVESKQHIAFVQIADKNGIEELTIRICDKKIVTSFAATAPPQNEERKDFAALQLTGEAFRAIPIQETFKVQIYDLLLFPVLNGNKEEDSLVFSSNAGIHILEDNFSKKNLLLHSNQYNAVYTGLVANQINIYASQMSGKIDKIAKVVRPAEQELLPEVPVHRVEEADIETGTAQEVLVRGSRRRQRECAVHRPGERADCRAAPPVSQPHQNHQQSADDELPFAERPGVHHLHEQRHGGARLFGELPLDQEVLPGQHQSHLRDREERGEQQDLDRIGRRSA